MPGEGVGWGGDGGRGNSRDEDFTHVNKCLWRRSLTGPRGHLRRRVCFAATNSAFASLKSTRSSCDVDTNLENSFKISTLRRWSFF